MSNLLQVLQALARGLIVPGDSFNDTAGEESDPVPYDVLDGLDLKMPVVIAPYLTIECGLWARGYETSARIFHHVTTSLQTRHRISTGILESLD